MKRVLVDMDGVLADVYCQFLDFEFRETGVRRDPAVTFGFSEPEAFPFYEKHVRMPGFFRTAPVMQGSVAGLEYLNGRYEVVILSSATEFPQSLSEKAFWLNEHFPFIDWRQMVFCGRKDVVRGDIMIDDHPKNLRSFPGEKIVFTQPHNAGLALPDCIRVSAWDEIVRML